MSTEENIQQYIDKSGKLLQLMADQVNVGKKQKEKLIAIIVLDSDSDKIKLQKIRLLLLQFQLSTSTENDPPKDLGSSYAESTTKLSIKQMECMTEIMDKTLEPLHLHQKLLKDIGNIIKSDLSDEEKIDAIINLLV